MKYYFVTLLLLFSTALFSQRKDSKTISNIALNLADKNDFLVINTNDTSSLSLNTPKTLTIEANINLKDTTGYVAIANKHWCLSRGGGYHFGVRNGKLTFVWTELGHCDYHAVIISEKTIIKPNKWYHVACTFDNGYVVLYVNGRRISAVQTGDIKGININSAPIIVGAYRSLNGDYSLFLNGYIDDFRVWNDAKNRKEIKRSKKSTIDLTSKNLLVNLTFDDSKLNNEGIYPSSPVCVGKSCENLFRFFISKR